MEATEQKVTRKSSTPIKVYCLPEERAAIEANAQAAGLSTDRYKNGGMILRSTIERKAGKVVLKDADYILAYVHTAVEGPFKHYYVLPDYGYDELDSTFFSSADRAARDLFFADSRQLMEKHGKNIREYRMDRDAAVERIMKGYYAVKVKEAELKHLKEELPHMAIVYKVNDLNGKIHYLIGYSDSLVAA